MSDLKVTKCEGEGMGTCKRCFDNGKWNRMWMYELSKIEGYEGCYCRDCVKAIVAAEEKPDALHSFSRDNLKVTSDRSWNPSSYSYNRDQMKRMVLQQPWRTPYMDIAASSQYQSQYNNNPYFYKSIEILRENDSPETIVHLLSQLCDTISHQQELLEQVSMTHSPKITMTFPKKRGKDA